MKELKIETPQGYEIDKENSTFERIVFKKKNNIKTWEDLCNADKMIKGFYISNIHSSIFKDTPTKARNTTMNVFLTEKEAKSARAAAMISQLMPYYGGAITDEEWGDANVNKFVIFRNRDEVQCFERRSWFYVLAFHTKEQRDEFLKNNLDLVKDYLMID